MLKQRVITALILLVLLVGSLLMSSLENPLPFFGLMAVMTVGACWEWLRMNGATVREQIVGPAAVAVLSLIMAGFGWLLPPWLWPWLALFWLIIAVVGMILGPKHWMTLPAKWRWILGCAALFFVWCAIAQAYMLGLNFLFSVCALIWVADTSAYFGGKRFGRLKLAPTISPGKTWEGAFFAVLGVMLMASLWALLDSWLIGPVGSLDMNAGAFDATRNSHILEVSILNVHSLYSVLLAAWGWSGLAYSVLSLVAMSILGDLLESLVKRAVGVKDSSGLLPGHGGILDRIDAWLPVFPWALALMWLSGNL